MAQAVEATFEASDLTAQQIVCDGPHGSLWTVSWAVNACSKCGAAV